MVLRVKLIGLLVVALLIMHSTANAQDGCSADFQQWTPAGLQQYSESIHDIAVHPDSSRLLFAATSSHLLKTSDCGSSWDTLRTAQSGFSSVEFHPTRPDTVLALSNRIVSSYDLGTSWSSIDGGISYGADGRVEDISIPEEHPQRIYAALTGTDSVNVYHTTDFGTSWSAAHDSTHQIAGKSFTSISVMGDYEPDRVFAATEDSGAIWLSRDVQSHWTLTSLNPERKEIDYLSDQGSGSKWLSLHNDSLLKFYFDYNDVISVDTVRVPDTLSNVQKIVGTRMGTAGGTLLASESGVFTLRIVVPTSDVDENTAWNNDNEGLPHQILTDMESNPYHYIFASLQDTLGSNGVYIRHKPVFTDIKDQKSSRPDQISLANNYPNPFNPSTQIRFQLPGARQVELSVYNAVGQRVATLVDRQMNAGAHAVTFDGSGLTSGVYIYRLQTKSFSQSKKMLLVK